MSTFAPEQRRALGVYYTPVEVVRAQVRLAADVLEQRLGCREAFADPDVLVVDPATGSGAYPLTVVAEVRGRSGHAPPGLAQRLRLLERTPGAADIARSRLAAALGGAEAVEVEARDALEVALALDGRVAVCLGNPPYRRGRAARQARAGSLLADFFEPGGGLHAKNLYNDYVYFWRWAIGEVFERRSGAGILSFVTASSYLRGPAFAGMRRHLRRVLDELWIVDLEGDQLAARTTDNVFPIRTPVAIAMGVRYLAADPLTPARVHYARLTGGRSEKLAALGSTRTLADLDWHSVPKDWCAPFLPRVGSAYASWPELTSIFPWQLSGAQLKRTWPIAPTPALLRARWQRLLELSGPERERALRPTRDRNLESTPADLYEPGTRLESLRTLEPGAPCVQPVAYAYRSFDRQWVLPDARLGDFMRPALWRVAGPRQVFLTSMLTHVLGRGPAAVATALVPDLDSFRGSFGARAVIPLWRDAGAARPNLADGLLAQLSAQYGFDVGAEQVLGYCYAVLGTPGFQARFEAELRLPGPRVPLTLDAELFLRASQLGQRLVWLHTFGQRCAPLGAVVGSVPVGRARMLEAVGRDYPRQYRYEAQQQRLYVGQGSFGPVTLPAWTFGVSGLRVVAGWVRRRVAPRPHTQRSSPLDLIQAVEWSDTSSRELLELVWLVEATLALQASQDALLDDIVRSASAVQAGWQL